MKIGVNARSLTVPFSGIGQYVENLFKNVGNDGNEYVLLVPKEVRVDFPENVSVVVIPEPRRGTGGMKKTYWEQVKVPEFFVKERVDLAFFPYPSNPWSKDFYKKNVRTVVTVHDCIPWKNKKYRKGVLSKMYHYQCRKAVGLADKVLTVSDASADDIHSVCGIAAEKIETIHIDASDEYKRAVSAKLRTQILERFELEEGRYLIYAGGFDARKNVKYLVEEYQKFAESVDGVDLVLAGGKLFNDKLYKSFDRIEDGHGRIVRTGFLDGPELRALYSAAAAFVHFSLAEGFNIPILEAANSGLPLILSDIPVHREVAGGAGVFVDVGKSGAGAEAMLRVLDDADDLRERSLAVAEKYSWEKTGEKFANVINSLENK